MGEKWRIWNREVGEKGRTGENTGGKRGEQVRIEENRGEQGILEENSDEYGIGKWGKRGE